MWWLRLWKSWCGDWCCWWARMWFKLIFIAACVVQNSSSAMIVTSSSRVAIAETRRQYDIWGCTPKGQVNIAERHTPPKSFPGWLDQGHNLLSKLKALICQTNGWVREGQIPSLPPLLAPMLNTNDCTSAHAAGFHPGSGDVTTTTAHLVGHIPHLGESHWQGRSYTEMWKGVNSYKRKMETHTASREDSKADSTDL